MAKHRALVIGISEYPDPAWKLPAVAADVREIAKLLGSRNGTFKDEEVLVLTDTEATSTAIQKALKDVLGRAKAGETVFVYFAGHGTVDSTDNSFYFVSHDADLSDLAATAMPLTGIRDSFDKSASQRAFLWLDFCHSGGILARRLGKSPDNEQTVLRRTLEVVQGHGKVIFAACTPEQSAYEDSSIGHGLFTHALLRGLQGDAEVDSEVTTNSLYDYIDRNIGSKRQRPMMFGHMTGRIVLMHYADRSQPPTSQPAKAVANLAVASSDQWLFLGNVFFTAERVRENKDGTITVEIVAKDSTDESALRNLRNHRGGRSDPIGFAHRNNGLIVQVREVEATTEGERQLWTLTLAPEETKYGGSLGDVTYQTQNKTYTPDDLAKLRGGRILLNNPPPPPPERRGWNEDLMLEHYIRGSNRSVDHCIVQAMWKPFKQNPKLFLQLARLASVFSLHASDVAAEILDLSLGPISDGKVHVQFKGRRRRVYANVEPKVIEIEGDCVLE
jgi:hypothetical protein